MRMFRMTSAMGSSFRIVGGERVSEPEVGPTPDRTMAEWVKVVLRGVGQVLFQDNPRTGLLFLLGIAVASPLMAAAGLVGAVIGTVAAKLLQFDDVDIRDGIYGFNSTLVGIAAFFFLKPVGPAVLLMVLGCAA